MTATYVLPIQQNRKEPHRKDEAGTTVHAQLPGSQVYKPRCGWKALGVTFTYIELEPENMGRRDYCTKCKAMEEV